MAPKVKVRSIPASRFTIPLPSSSGGLGVGRANASAAILVGQWDAALKKLGFVPLPPLDFPDRPMKWLAWAHPEGVFLAGEVSTVGSGDPRLHAVSLRASLDLGWFHHGNITREGFVEGFCRLLDGSVVGHVQVGGADWEVGLYRVLHRIQSKGRLRNFSAQAQDVESGMAKRFLPRELDWQGLPGAWKEALIGLAPSGLEKALSASSSASQNLELEGVLKIANGAILNLRQHGRHTGRRYPSPAQRHRLAQWVEQGAARVGLDPASVLDFDTAAGGISQLMVWTWMAHAPVARQGIGAWLALAPREALENAVLPQGSAPGWGDVLSDQMKAQPADCPHLSQEVGRWLATLKNRLGPDWVRGWTQSPWEPMVQNNGLGLLCHAQAPSSFVALAQAFDELGATVSLPSGIEDWSFPSWEKVFQSGASDQLDWSPVRAYVSSRHYAHSVPPVSGLSPRPSSPRF